MQGNDVSPLVLRLSIHLGKCQDELPDLAEDPREMTKPRDSAAHAEIRSRLIERLAEMEVAVANRVPLPTAQA